MSDTAAVFSPATLHIDHADDCRRIREVAKRHGFTLSVRDAAHVWAQRCRGSENSWLPLPEKDAALFDAILEPLHEWLAENGDPVPASPDRLPRVPIIDEADAPCELCAQWAAAKYVTEPETGKNLGFRCDECGEVIPDQGLMRGRGFDGIVPHHYHLKGVGPAQVPGRAVILQELCPDCYRVHRKAVYPNESPKELERHLRV